MKLSEVPTEQGMQALYVLLANAEQIIEDKELSEQLSKTTDDMLNANKFGKIKATKTASIFLKNHSELAYDFLSQLNGITKEEYKKRPFFQAIIDLIGIITDKDVADFFISVSQSDLAQRLGSFQK